MIHYITVRVSAHATEDRSRVQNALDFFLQNCKGKASDISGLIDMAEVEGYYGNPILMYNIKISRKAQTRAFIHFIKDNLSPSDLADLRTELSSRLDDDLVFHLRFNKQAAFMGRVEMTSSSDAVIVKVKIATYPKDIRKAQVVLEELFG